MLQNATICSIDIAAPVERVFAFITRAANWPSWAIMPCNAVQALPEGCWLLDSLGGTDRLAIVAKANGQGAAFTLTMRDDQWSFDCQLWPNRGTTTLRLTFSKPAHCDEACFEDYTEIARNRLHRLKTLIEGAGSS